MPWRTWEPLHAFLDGLRTRLVDREHKALCDIIMSLPPVDGGGRRAQSAVLKRPEH